MKAHELVAEILNRPVENLDRDLALDQVPRFDSIALVNLVVRIEEVLGRQLSESEIEGLRTVGAIDDVLKAG